MDARTQLCPRKPGPWWVTVMLAAGFPASGVLGRVNQGKSWGELWEIKGQPRTYSKEQPCHYRPGPPCHSQDLSSCPWETGWGEGARAVKEGDTRGVPYNSAEDMNLESRFFLLWDPGETLGEFLTPLDSILVCK